MRHYMTVVGFFKLSQPNSILDSLYYVGFTEHIKRTAIFRGENRVWYRYTIVNSRVLIW